MAASHPPFVTALPEPPGPGHTEQRGGSRPSRTTADREGLGGLVSAGGQQRCVGPCNQRLAPNPDQTHGLGSSHVVGTSGPMSREGKGAQKGGQSLHTHAHRLPGTQAASHRGPTLPALAQTPWWANPPNPSLCWGRGLWVSPSLTLCTPGLPSPSAGTPTLAPIPPLHLHSLEHSTLLSQIAPGEKHVHSWEKAHSAEVHDPGPRERGRGLTPPR